MEEARATNPRIFVSYSRKDSAPARKLINAFAEMGYDVWVDWEDIPPAARWMDKIEEGIEKSDAFIFLISPDSIKSEVCNVELDHAADPKYNKRIIPIVLRDVPAKKTNNNIRQLNWIFMREEDDFEVGLKKFRDALELDFSWVAEHNKLLEKTLDWHHGKTTSLLLRGNELQRVQMVVEDAKDKKPKLTDLQKMFLDASAKNERRRYILWGIVSVVITVLVGLTTFASSSVILPRRTRNVQPKMRWLPTSRGPLLKGTKRLRAVTNRRQGLHSRRLRNRGRSQKNNERLRRNSG